SRDGLSDSPCFVDQFTNFRIIDQKSKSFGIVIVVTQVTHEKPPLALCGNFLRLLPENTAVRRGGHRCGGVQRRTPPLIWLWLYRLAYGCPLDNLDAGAPGIGDVRYGAAGGRLARRLVELDAFRLDLLHESCVVFHVKTDVVQHAPARGCLLCVSPGEPDLYARDVHDGGVIAATGFPAEGLRIPGLRFGDFSLRQG